MKKTLIILACLSLSIPLFAELKISKVSGTVEVFSKDEWKDAQQGMLLAVNDKVKTYGDSYAILVLDGNTRIWVKQESEMQITSIGNYNFFELSFGKIRAKVEKLSREKKFKVKTPVSVASIRGTEFISSADGELAVLEGNVSFSDATEQKAIDVAQGFMGMIDTAGKLMAQQLTPDQLNAIQSEWGAIKGAGQQGEKTENPEQKKLNEETAKLRQELHDAVASAKTEIAVAKEYTNELKEADFTTGRSMRDVHGNLVRIEQDMFRPTNSTIQILNLTKRPDGYKYSDKTGWGYNNGQPTGSRLDTIDIKLTMNMALPEQITEWPAFISDKGDNMHPTNVEFKMTNQYDEMKNIGDWKLKGQPDEKGTALTEDRLVFTGYINNWKIDPNYSDQNYPTVAAQYKKTWDASGSDSGDLWAHAVSPMFKLIDPSNSSNSKLVRIGSESYGLDNGGGILNINNFTNSSDNPFAVLKQIAGEEIIFCREVPSVATARSYTEDTYGDFKNDTDFFTKRNLDLIFTPDLVIAIAQKLVNQINNLQKSDKSKQ